jgi:uncharacterized protein YutE (UPF0331/DUF86 family)
MTKERLKTYFTEANKHSELINDSLEELQTPIEDYDSLSKIQKFALNALIFRFSKLQDLIGAKIFRNYLEYSGYNTQGISYFDILKEIEQEAIVDIDTWSELRELRNKIAHEYPEELDEMLESINLFLKKSLELTKIAQKLEYNFYEIERKRG